jgi:hydrogenase expression/formation protein HypC
MCLAVPARIVEINGMNAIADAGGIRRSVDIRLVENAVVGDYVIVHAGFAIQKLDQEEALKTLQMMREIEGQAPEVREFRSPKTHEIC